MNAERNVACEFPGSSSTNSIIYHRNSSVPAEEAQVLQQLQGEENNFFQSVGIGALGISQEEANGSVRSSGAEGGYFSGAQSIIVGGEQLLSCTEPSFLGNQVEQEVSFENTQESTPVEALATTVYQNRRRPRKTNPLKQEVPGQVYTLYKPVELQLPAPGVKKEDSTLDSAGVKKEDDYPLAVPTCIPRYFDQKREVVTLSPADVSVKFFRGSTALKKGLPGSPFLVSNLLASRGETFSRVLLATDIQQPKQRFGPIESSTLIDGAFLTTTEATIAADKFILPKNTLIVRHPLLRVGDTGQRHYVFPIEKFLEDGSRELKIQSGFVVRGPEGNIQIQFEKEEDIESYLSNIQINMNQFNQINNYQLSIPESGFSDGDIPCYTTYTDYSNANGSSSMPTIPIYNQQQQQQQTAVYFPRIEDCTGNQDGSAFQRDTIVIYYPASQNIENFDHVPVSLVPMQQQMSVIRATPVSGNSHHGTSFSIELPSEVNFSMHQGREIGEAKIVTSIKSKVPKQKKARVKPPPKANNLAQNLQPPTSNHWFPPDSTNPDIPLIGYTDSSLNTSYSLLNLQNNSTPKQKLTTVHMESVINSDASAATELGKINSVINQSSLKPPSCVLPTVNSMFSNNKKYNSPKSKLSFATTPNNSSEMLAMNNEATVHVIVTEKTEEKEEIRTDPRTLDGYLAMCQHCGIGSEDLHTCVRCKHKLPPNLHIVKDTWKVKTTEIVKKPTRSAPTIPAVKMDIAKPVELEVNNKRNFMKKSKSETTTPTTRRVKGGGRRSKQEECIVLSSDDEEPKAKIPKELDTGCDSPIVNIVKASPVLMKTLQVNLTHVQIPTLADGVSTPPKGMGPKVMLTRNPLEGGSSSVITEPEATPEEVIEAIESMTTSSTQKGPFATVLCRSIRVGNYKCSMPSMIPKMMYKVVFSKKGILFHVPHAGLRSKVLACAVPAEKILNISVHFRQRLPVVFISTGPKYASWVRKRLGLSDNPSQANYFCSLNGGTCQKYIIFLADVFSEMDIVTMKQIYGATIHELDYMRANELLTQITLDCKVSEDLKPDLDRSSAESPSTSTSASDHFLRSSANCNPPVTTSIKSSGTTETSHNQVDCSGNKTIMMYKGMPVLQNDILCLADEQFLNDSIIDFWMRYIQHELLSEDERSRIYMFSTFFYKRLTTRNKKRTGAYEDDSSLSSAAEKRHARVKRWTKDVDIFEKDFIIIPINENCHWFLAVICYPGLKGVHNLETGEPIPDYKKRSKGKGKGPTKTVTKMPPEPLEMNGVTGTDAPIRSESRVPNLDLTDKHTLGMEETNSEQLKIKQPCIFIFDSLAGEPRSRVYSTLREYLKIEYKTRKGEDREFTKTSIPGGMPRVPQQPNHCDCGIFTLFYVECFFRKPIRSFDIPMEQMRSWYSIEWEMKREEIFHAVQELVGKICPETLELIPNITFPPPKAVVERKKQKEQIQSAPVETVEKVSSHEELMDVDVCVSSSDQGNGSLQVSERPSLHHRETTPLRPTVAEIVRASPTDNAHDHDYASRDKLT